LRIINIERYKRSSAKFDKKWCDHWTKKNDFGGFFRWKLEIEAGNGHILDDDHRGETHDRLCEILPGWQTYRPNPSNVCLGFLKDSLRRVSNAYDQIRRHSLLEFDDIPDEPLRLIWHELGRAKENDGSRNEPGTYYIKALSVPLMLIWGQTPTFDSKVRRNFLKDFMLYPKYRFNDNRWSFEDWQRVMRELQKDLENNAEVVDYFRRETLKRFGTDLIVPFGRFLDITYYYPSDDN